MKIAHFFSDPKFIHGAHQSFEAVAPGASTYFYDAIGDIPESLKSISPVKFEMNKEGISQLAEFDIWVIHGLSGNRLKLLNYKKEQQKVVWIGMGYDYYDLIFPNELDLYENKTLEKSPLPNRLNFSYSQIFSIRGLKSIARKMGVLRLRKLLKIRKLGKIDIFCPVLNSEYKMVDSRYRSFLPKFKDWNYAHNHKLVEFLAKPLSIDSKLSRVLIGNSATATNNHLEVFDLIRQNSLFPSSEFIVSLAYGDEDYKIWLNQIGYSLFSERYKPFENFVPLEKYLVLISSCSHVIMNHRRQQAGANVTFALAAGARVIMNPVSPLYHEWLDRGAIVNSIEELNSSPASMQQPLTKDEVLINRKVVAEHIHPLVFENKTRALLEELGFSNSLC